MAPRQIVIFSALVAVAAGLPLLLRPAHPTADPADSPGAAEAPMASGLPVSHAVATAEAEALLRAGRPWRAAQLMRRHLERHPDARPGQFLLAARAEAEWGGWGRVRELLEGMVWLATEEGGEGLFLLARAREEQGDRAAAADAYRRFLDVASRAERHEENRTIARIRGGLLLLRSGEGAAAGELLAPVRAAAPAVTPWIDLLSAEALATHGDSAAVRALVQPLDDAAFLTRARRARLISLREAGDPAAVQRLATSFRDSGPDAARAEVALFAARAANALGQTGAARRELQTALALAPRSTAALEAARELETLGSLSSADRVAVARVYDQHGQKRRAASLYAEWLAAGAGSAEELRQVRLSLGRAHLDAGAFREAEEALRPLVGLTGDLAADALYLTGRAQWRAGQTSAARSTYLRVAERFPGTQPGAEALYLVADMHHEANELRQAGALYRRVADEFRGRDRAGLALMRLAGMAYLSDDFAGAARLWNEYRTSYPRGQLWLQATYWMGIAQQRTGDRSQAEATFRDVRARDPLSYYALLAADRLGVAYWPVPMGPIPQTSDAGRRRVEGWMRTVDLLRRAELHEEAEAEAERLVRLAGGDRDIGYPLAEALNERGYTVRGIRLGLQLQGRDGQLNPRLLRILYPFPYRNLIEAEAHEMGLDPLLAAALIRQESMFSARISSPVGARGLMQVMPETGRAVASQLGISDWDEAMLFQPEINVHIGTRYLADQMRQYAGSLPAVFSAYNAGPHRVEAWRRFAEFGDEELFTERIPFRETRDYVKILTRNLAIYEALYGATAR